MVQLSHPYMTAGKAIALTRQTFVGKVMPLLFNMLSRLVITFLPRTRVVQSDATHTLKSSFISLKCHIPQCDNFVVFIFQANLWLQAACLSLPLPDFWVFSAHSQYSCSQGIFTCHGKKFSECLCLTQLRLQRINRHTLWTWLQQYVHPVILAAKDCGLQQPESSFSPVSSWICLQFLFFPLRRDSQGS